MPVNPNATIEITAFSWVPEFAQGVVRDLRARWALEEAGLDYHVRLIGQQRPPEYLKEQPFDQVPVLRDGDLSIFESGAIAQYIGEKSEALLPRDAQGASARSSGPMRRSTASSPRSSTVLPLTVFYADEEWAKLAGPAPRFRANQAQAVSDWLGDQPWLEGDRFTIGDLIMVTVLRFLPPYRDGRQFPNLGAYLQARRGAARLPARARRPARPVYAANQPQPEGAAA